MVLRTETELMNVLAGKTAEGHGSSLHRLSFSKDPKVIHQAAIAADLMIRVMASTDLFSTAKDEIRTAVIWKLAAYVSKAGTAPPGQNLFGLVMLAAGFMADNPRLITAPTGLGNIIRQAQEQLNAKRALQRKQAAGLPEPSTLPAPTETPSCPIIWQSPNGDYQLVQLIHPVHVFDEGTKMSNCMASHFTGRPAHAAIAHDAPPRLLRLTYWCAIVERGFRIFSFRRGDVSLACFCILTDRSVSDFQVHLDATFVALQTLERAMVYVDRTIGPLAFGRLHRCRSPRPL